MKIYQINFSQYFIMTRWFSHVKKIMAMHPKKPLRGILRIATQTYKKKRVRHNKTRRRHPAKTRRKHRRRRRRR